MTTTKSRLRRALALVNRVRDLGNGAYRVPSGTAANKTYRVVMEGEVPVCSCPDYTWRGPETCGEQQGMLCKHADAVLIHLAGPAGRAAVETELAK